MQPVAHRSRTLVEERDEQSAREPDQLPAEEQSLNGPGQTREHHAEDENGEQCEEAVVTGFTVHVARGERAKGAAQEEREDHQRNREAVENELYQEMVVGDADPLRGQYGD